MKTLANIANNILSQSIEDSKNKMCDGFLRLGHTEFFDEQQLCCDMVCPDCLNSMMITCRHGGDDEHTRNKLVAFCCDDECLKKSKAAKKPTLPGLPVLVDWSRFGVPETHLKKSFDNIDGMPRGIESAKAFVHSKQTCLTFSGESGAGKTHMAVAILKKFHYETKKPAVFIHIADLLSELRECQTTNTNESRVINKYAGYPMLVIDDLGSTRGTDWQIEKTRELMQKRFGVVKTVITTNYTDDELQNTYGIIFMRRLSDAGGKLLLKCRKIT